MDVPGAQYGAVKDVNVLQTVDDFTARWVAQAKLDVDPSMVTLRLVRCAGEEPTAEEEAAATALSSRRTLRNAGVTAGCSLLADTVQLALLAVERKEEAERQRAEREEEAERQRAEREEEAERQRAERRARRGAQHYPSSTS